MSSISISSIPPKYRLPETEQANMGETVEFYDRDGDLIMSLLLCVIPARNTKVIFASLDKHATVNRVEFNHSDEDGMIIHVIMNRLRNV